MQLPDDNEIETAKQIIATAQARTGRKCGRCSMCCKVLSIKDDPRSADPITKPANQWCKHCTPGSGCSIYEQRPDVCQTFACLWLIKPEFKDHWYPMRSQMVVHFRSVDGKVYLNFEVDSVAADRWRQEPYYTEIRNMARVGLTIGNCGHQFLVRVIVGSRIWVVLPNKVEEMKTDHFVVGRVGEDEWEVMFFNSLAEAQHYATTSDELRVQGMTIEERVALAADMRAAAIKQKEEEK